MSWHDEDMNEQVGKILYSLKLGIKHISYQIMQEKYYSRLGMLK